MEIDNKKLFKHFNLLYIEDDNVVRKELFEILVNFFNDVYVAKNGKEALELFEKEKIDIILSDINMPELNGIEMLSQIRKIDEDIPTVFCTAYSDNDFLMKSIKLNVDDYLIKPVDIRKLLIVLRKIAKNLYQDILLEQNNKELKKMKDIIDSTNIVIKTDTDMKITYVNELFCEISGYSKDELIGEELKVLKHQDISSEIYTKLYENALNNIPWSGTLKNLKKDGTSYSTDCYMITMLDDAGIITGTISIQKDITEELNKKREIQKSLLKEKNDMFRKSKESNVEQSMKLNELNSLYEKSQEDLHKALNSIDKFIFNSKKDKLEIKNLKVELGLYKKESTNSNNFVLSRENSDLKVKVKRLEEKNSYLRESNTKELSNLKLHYEMQENEYKQKIEELSAKLDSMKNDEVLVEKLNYWKEKASNESIKLDSLEKKILDFADAKLMGKIFE